MINLKEPCKNCQCIDSCIKAVQNTIKNIPTGHGRDAFDCVHFSDFECAFMKCVHNSIHKALMYYNPKNPVNYTKSVCEELMAKLATSNTVKKVKVSPALYSLVRALFDEKIIYDISFFPGKGWFIGTPIEVDPDKEGYDYQFIYEGEDE